MYWERLRLGASHQFYCCQFNSFYFLIRKCSPRRWRRQPNAKPISIPKTNYLNVVIGAVIKIINLKFPVICRTLMYLNCKYFARPHPRVSLRATHPCLTLIKYDPIKHSHGTPQFHQILSDASHLPFPPGFAGHLGERRQYIFDDAAFTRSNLSLNHHAWRQPHRPAIDHHRVALQV